MKNIAPFCLAALLLGGCGSDSVSTTTDGGTTTSIVAPVTTPIAYNRILYPNSVPGGATAVTGVRGVEGSTDVYISGIYYPPNNAPTNALLYTGPLSGAGTWRTYAFPSSAGATVTSSNFYGPNNFPGGVQVAGSYSTTQGGKQSFGLLYQGPLDGSGNYRTLLPVAQNGQPVLNTIAHSTMGGLVVGNFDTDLITGKAFIYDINANAYTELVKPGAKSLTAYGIRHNGGTNYTIAGGFSDADAQGLSIGYLVDWDSATRTASNWTHFSYRNQPLTSVISHIEGITTDGAGGYNLAVDWANVGQGGGASFAHVPRQGPGPFGQAVWTDVSFPSSAGANVVANSANTVFQNNLLGVFLTQEEPYFHSFFATVQP